MRNNPIVWPHRLPKSATGGHCHEKTMPLPMHFPPWLNFHDPNDYLSYAACAVFNHDPRITDEQLTSRQPRLMAHGAYWTEPTLWDRIAAFIQQHREGTSTS